MNTKSTIFWICIFSLISVGCELIGEKAVPEEDIDINVFEDITINVFFVFQDVQFPVNEGQIIVDSTKSYDLSQTAITMTIKSTGSLVSINSPWIPDTSIKLSTSDGNIIFSDLNDNLIDQSPISDTLAVTLPPLTFDCFPLKVGSSFSYSLRTRYLSPGESRMAGYVSQFNVSRMSVFGSDTVYYVNRVTNGADTTTCGFSIVGECTKLEVQEVNDLKAVDQFTVNGEGNLSYKSGSEGKYFGLAQKTTRYFSESRVSLSIKPQRFYPKFFFKDEELFTIGDGYGYLPGERQITIEPENYYQKLYTQGGGNRSWSTTIELLDETQ